MSESAYRLRDLWSLPGLLSLARVVLAAYFPFVVHDSWRALCVVALAGLTDLLDGFIARRFRLASPTGAALDPVADKIFATSVVVSSICAALLPFAWALLLSVRELIELPMVLWLACTPRGKLLGARHLRANTLGKLTTGAQFVALVGVLLQRGHVLPWVVATALLGTLAACSYVAAFRRALREQSC